MRTAFGKVYSGPDDEQLVMFEYEFISSGGWFEKKSYDVNFCHVVNNLTIAPSDLKLDLEFAIAEDLGVDVNDINITCSIAIPNCIQEPKISQPLFI